MSSEREKTGLPEVTNEGKIIKPKDQQFIVAIGPLVRDAETNERFVTITISQKMLHYIMEGLAKYRGERQPTPGTTDEKEHKDTTQIIDEFNKVKDVLVEEVKEEKIKQEPNAVYDTEGTSEEVSSI